MVKKVIHVAIYPITYAAIFGLAFLMLGKEASYFLKWWAALFFLGIVCLPMTVCMFRQFHDKGYLFSKVIGIAISGYLLWLLSSVKLLRFTSFNAVLCVVIVALGNGALLYYQRKKKNRFEKIDQLKVLTRCMNEELIFLLLFLIWCYIKGFKAEAYGTEKFMDYGFMTAMMRAEYMPPYDSWYSGGIINYYYFGQYLSTFLTKLSHVTVNVGYNLMLMSIAAFATMLPYSIIYNVTDHMLKKRKQKKSCLPALSGILGGALLSFSSNLHYPIFRFVVPALQEMLGIEVSKYWFPDATRYIGYQPDTHDKTIHEFPSYSIVLGDLHAHYINILFVVTVIGLLFVWYCRQDRMRMKETAMLADMKEEKLKMTWRDYIREVFEPNILMITFFIGMFHMTNFWDYPIYYVVSGAVILFSNATRFRFSLRTLFMTALQGIVVLLGSYAVSLPFTINFDQISSQINLATNHTRFYQLLILWGLPVCIVIGFLVSLIAHYRHSILKEAQEEPRRGKAWNHIKECLNQMDYTDLFILLLGLCAIGLVLLPEVIYVKDIYSGDYKRANTMFKLTYQAFILFSICSGYILLKLFVFGETYRQKRNAAIGILLSVICIGYVGHSVNAWFHNIFIYDNRESLDAAAFLEEKFPEDFEAIAWLNEHVVGQAVVLEANGKSYTDYERVSAFTGLSTVAGWYTHEWLWRGNLTELNQRNEDIKTIYTTKDYDVLKQLVEQYQIDYIYVGKLEREEFKEISENLIEELGEVVFIKSNPFQKNQDTFIVKVNH